MGDLYNRLKRIKAQRGGPDGQESQPRGAVHRDAADARSDLAKAVSDADLPAPGPEWQPVAPGVYERTTLQPISTARCGDNFATTGRWDSLSPLTRRLAGMTPVFLDIETTGISGGAGNVAFLIGVGTPAGGTRDGAPVGANETAAVEVRQLLLLDPGSEGAQLDRFSALLAAIPDPQYVTYNGASFDLPVLRSRFIMHRRQFPEASHFDLLHLVRRLYARRIGSCSLGAVETQVLGNPRTDDVPGSEAPARYLEYVRTGDNRVIEPVFLHHLRDIANLAEVALALNGVLLGTDGSPREKDASLSSPQGPVAPDPLPPDPLPPDPLPPDPLSYARFLIERGLPEYADRARTLLEQEYTVTAARVERVRAFARSRGMRTTAGVHGRYPSAWTKTRELLAELARKSGDREQYRAYAEELYRELARYKDLIRLVKLLEHDAREYDQAISLIEAWGATHGYDDALTHRLARLRRQRA